MEKQVLVEMRVPRRASARRVRELASALADHGLDLDLDYLVSSEPSEAAKEPQRYRHVLVRGRVLEGREVDLEGQPNVVRIWSDAPIAPLAEADEEEVGVRPKSPFAF